MVSSEDELLCSDLYIELLEEKEKVQHSEKESINLEVELEHLTQENGELTRYIELIEEQNTCCNCADAFENKNGTLAQVGKRQQQRKLKELKTKAQRALWFLESYGVTLNNLSISDSNCEEIHLDLSSAQDTHKTHI